MIFEGDLKIKCGKKLYPTESVKYLGVKTDTNLSWQYHINDLSINPHMHKLGPRGPTNYIFRDQFYSKNARKLRFHVFLHFYARKHMISSF